MTDALIFWSFVTSAFRVLIAAMVIYELTCHEVRYWLIERLGLGILGGAGLLTIPTVWTGSESPFEKWSGALFAAGVFMHVVGRTMRNIRHDRNSAETLRRARAHLEGRDNGDSA